MDLAGLRVLVVEDEFLVALGLEGELRTLGCDVVGPVASLSAAMAAARSEGLDAALLDVSLGSESVFPAAAVLADRGVPFVFCSAFTGREPMPRALADRPRVAKPFTGRMIADALVTIVNGNAGEDGLSAGSGDSRADAAHLSAPERS
ncbi:response regulator [Xanthobacter sp. V2C-8]|uniref:response regulator n=1 Tax=Xanthobacter albus TaxID=3119929 RepID=UPI00372672E1